MSLLAALPRLLLGIRGSEDIKEIVFKSIQFAVISRAVCFPYPCTNVSKKKSALYMYIATYLPQPVLFHPTAYQCKAMAQTGGW